MSANTNGVDHKARLETAWAKAEQFLPYCVPWKRTMTVDMCHWLEETIGPCYIEKWSRDTLDWVFNPDGKWDLVHGGVYFLHERDALHFKLRWG